MATAAPAFAAWNPDSPNLIEEYTNPDSEYRQQQEQTAQQERDEIDALVDSVNSRIEALPDNAGLAEVDELKAIRADYQSLPDYAKVYVSTENKNKLEAAERNAANPSIFDQVRVNGVGALMQSSAVTIVYVVWLIFFYVQLFFAYGTAYRAAKRGGDNGVSLFGWLLVHALASVVPFLEIFLWHRSKAETK